MAKPCMAHAWRMQAAWANKQTTTWKDYGVDLSALIYLTPAQGQMWRTL